VVRRFRPRVGSVSFTLALLLTSLGNFNPSLRGAAGSLDPSFGVDGKVMTPVSPTTDTAFGVAVQPDGKIVLAGGGGDFALARYRANGTLDPTFSGDGKQTTALGPGGSAALAVAIQPDGRIVAAGESNDGNAYDFAVTRYLTNGSLDPSFSNDGIVITAVSNAEDRAEALALQADGKILVAGNWRNFNSNGDREFAVVRYLSDGTIDSSFSSDGIATTNLGPSSGASGIAVQSDGKIVVAGSRYASNKNEFAVVRYRGDGTLDPTFSSDGIDTAGFSMNDVASAMALTPGGKIVVAGEAYDGTQEDFAVTRFNPDGGLDSTFSGDGIQITSFGNRLDRAEGAVVQPDGKIVLAGVRDGPYASDFAIVRHNADGSYDTTFSEDGRQTTGFPRGGSGTAVALQPDGRIVVAGASSRNSDGAQFAAVRYLGKRGPTPTTPGVISGIYWYLNNGFDYDRERTFAFGAARDIKVVGDWDGNGTFTPGVVRGNVWYLNNGFDSSADRSFTFGATGDGKIVGDWDGNGTFTPGVVRGNVWYLNNGFDSSSDRSFIFGAAGDLKVVGDWDGNGTFTPGIVRGNVWYVNSSFDPSADRSFTFGAAGDVKVVGDWDGNGTFTPGIVRGDVWYLNNGFDSSADRSFTFGLGPGTTTVKVVGDWD
jgi:uncharacterized delta-60 repeat protein